MTILNATIFFFGIIVMLILSFEDNISKNTFILALLAWVYVICNLIGLIEED